MQHFTKKEWDQKFTIEKNDYGYSVTRFYSDDMLTIEAEYYYYNGWCDYKRSWGFTPDSVGEFRKKKAHKIGKCFFSLETGWWGSWNGKEYIE